MCTPLYIDNCMVLVILVYLINYKSYFDYSFLSVNRQLHGFGCSCLF